MERQLRYDRFRTGKIITRIAEIPGDPTKTPIVLVPPFAATLETQRPLMIELANLSGSSVAAFETIDAQRKLFEPRAQRGEDESGLTEIPAAIRQNADNFAQVINRTYPDKPINVVAQSMGAATYLAAQSLYELDVESAILVSPAGLTPKPSVAKIYAQYAHHTAQGLWHLARNFRERSYMVAISAKTIAFNRQNIAKLVKEANALAQVDLFDLFRKLPLLGVNVGIIAFEQDVLMPARDLQERLNRDEPNNPLHIFQLEQGGHHPTSTRTYAEYATILDGMFQKLQS